MQDEVNAMDLNIGSINYLAVVGGDRDKHGGWSGLVLAAAIREALDGGKRPHGGVDQGSWERHEGDTSWPLSRPS